VRPAGFQPAQKARNQAGRPISTDWDSMLC